MSNKNTWSMKDQFQKYNIKKQKSRSGFALNDFGKFEGIFVYGNRGSELEMTADLDIKKINVGTETNPIYKEDVVGAQILCPRCNSPLYIKGKNLPDGKEIIVHWDISLKSEVDGLKRPPISVDGVIGCDYYDFEINSTTKSRNSNVSMRCGWKGGIIGGQCFDHMVNPNMIVPKPVEKKEEETVSSETDSKVADEVSEEKNLETETSETEEAGTEVSEPTASDSESTESEQD
jgi:hypothetical protein